jgi:hypothetical protein
MAIIWLPASLQVRHSQRAPKTALDISHLKRRLTSEAHRANECAASHRQVRREARSPRAADARDYGSGRASLANVELAIK